MQSKLLERFGISPTVEHEIELRNDDCGIPRLWFRSIGNPLVGLDLGGASQLRQLLEHAGNSEKAREIERLIAKAQRV